jgi:hypothetical protein
MLYGKGPLEMDLLGADTLVLDDEHGLEGHTWKAQR